jgi:tRNA-specific 2-thiouridylase
MNMGKVQKRVMVAISGGVDSSVAAARLIEQNYQCTGVFVRMLSSDIKVDENLKGHLADAQKVCKHLGIPLHIVDYSWEMQQIIGYFMNEYAIGRTPNPCVRCNARLKFSKLLAFARDMGADYLATGHYARIVEHEGFSRLARGRCRAKDQSYVLFGIRRSELGSILFPNGDAQSKDEIRAYARELHLPVSEKGDSQEICFVPDDDYVNFIGAAHSELTRPGLIVDVNGKILGEHKGLYRYTIGQRRGLRIAAGEPIYVVKIDPITNVVTVGSKEDLARTSLIADELNWHIDKPKGPREFDAQIRYAHKAVRSTVEFIGEDRVLVKFSEPQYAVTPGQAVVFYDEDRVAGGGWISDDRTDQ